MVNQNVDTRLADINMDEAPATSSFMYNAKLVVEEWIYLPEEKRRREGYVKSDVPYIHLAFQPLNYRITDGGLEGDNLEHTYAAIKTTQGELTPKGSARDEIVKAFAKLNFPRNTVSDLTNSPAVGKNFKVKRYTRTYTDRVSKESRNAELMNVPVDILPDDWAPAPGTDIPVYSRARRERGTAGTGGSGGAASGSVVRPIGVSLADVAKALAGSNVPANESAVRNFILDRNDLAQGDVLELAMGSKLLGKLVEVGEARAENGVVAVG